MRRIAFLFVCLTVLTVGSAVAQPSVSVRGNVGAAFFRSPNGLQNILNSGVDVGLGLNIQFYRGLEVFAEGGYDEFSLNGDNVSILDENLRVGSSSDVQGGEYQLLNASLGLRYVLINKADAEPYLSASVGIFRSAIAETDIYQSGRLVREAEGRTTTGLGVQLAAGVDFKINETYSFFFEPRYVIVDTDDQDFGLGTTTRFVPVRLGLDVAL